MASARSEYAKCKTNILSTLPNWDVVERELRREANASKQRIIEEAVRAELERSSSRSC